MKIVFSIAIILIHSLYVSAQQVKINTTLGAITVQLEPEKAPITVANFMKYVEGGFYEGGLFFRTVRADNQPVNPVKITVIQGGANPLMQSVLFDPILLERTSETGLLHKNGTISMARSEPDTAQDSFFICIEDQPELDFGGKRNPDGQGFAAFGQVIDGMDVVEMINQAEVEGQSINPPILILNMVVME